MPELNKANRQVCDVEIRELKTMKPFLFLDTANATTAGLTGDSVYAMAKGARKIAFQNPLEGQITMRFQVYPMKLLALLSDGTIDSTASFAEHKVVKCDTAGELNVTIKNGSIMEGTAFAYPEGEFGEESSAIPVVVSGNKLTGSFEKGTVYEVGYIVSKTSGVKKISFNNKKVPKDYFITMSTVDKDEDGMLTPFVMTAYHASVRRDFTLEFSSEGDPAEVEIQWDLLEDKDGNIFDMVELTDDAV